MRLTEELPSIPGYRIERKLAEGGMGVVFRALDETLDRPVAIKMIRGAILASSSAESEAVGRFLREAKAAAQIRSNHVAHVLQFGQTKDRDLYLVLEYLDGVTLHELLKREPRLSLERAVRITRQVCRGMEAAHQLGIVHRDLKPSNVMLVDQDGDPEFAKILDFGVAKVAGDAESGVTKAGMLVGTYTCMAPEQVAGETIDARTDIYALAVLLYRLITGKVLFEGRDVTAVLYHHVHTPPPLPSRMAPDAKIPPALDALVLRCLEKEPNRRVRSMADLDRALGLALEMGDNAEEVLEQAPTLVKTGIAAAASAHTAIIAGAFGESTGSENVVADDDGEVFSDVRRADPGAETRTAQRHVVVDPPTPGTMSAAGLAPPPPSKEAKRALPVAAIVTVVVVVVAIAAVIAWRLGADRTPRSDDVVVVLPAAEPAAQLAAQPAAPAAPPAEDPVTAAPVPEPEPVAPTAEPASAPSDDGDEAAPAGDTAKKKPAAKKKPTSSTTSEPEDAKKPKKPQFIRVRTEDGEQ